MRIIKGKTLLLITGANCEQKSIKKEFLSLTCHLFPPVPDRGAFSGGFIIQVPPDKSQKIDLV
ncbi:hypothetical protein [Algicola sagamiensis]|uniref:hypothetical protein n=1 Tax=Algicola sagamiensis TaxID=163869 RepID=UPI00037805DB|nr:hypothetical protein [Algicola sagamiensis]